MPLQKQFEKFYENILLTTDQKTDAKNKYTGVCKKLHDHYYPSATYNGKTKLLIGSYGEHTNIRPARDIDVIFIMPPSKFETYNDNKSNCQSQLLQDIRNILQIKYPDTKIKAFEKVVVLEFTESKHNVEVLPGWENSDGTFKIPDSKNDGTWENSDPRIEIEKMKSQDSITGRTKRLIQMIKKWDDNCSVSIGSYQIKNLVLQFFTQYSYGNKNDATIIKDFFIYAHNNEQIDSIKSHFETAQKRAIKAYDFVLKTKFHDATIELRKIFGADFPTNANNETSSKKVRVITNPPKPWISN